MKKKLSFVLVALVVTYGLLMIPGKNSIKIQSAGNSEPFIWDQNEKWESLESAFTEARENLELNTPGVTEALILDLNNLLEELEGSSFSPESEKLNILLNKYFDLAPIIAAQEKKNPEFLEIYNRARRIIKEESVNWDIDKRTTRDALYRTLYGMRATVEEVLLQYKDPFDPVLYVKEEDSETPSTNILGIKVHSGDLLVSRGGAEVSALISRGNDYPGNFSHVALIYIEEGTNIPYLIEAHIERGVAIATLEEYIKDRKLRFMVLRPRSDLPEIQENPMLPHIAAKEVFEEVQQRHIPYDFKMDFYDPEAMFCSEVGSYAYKNNGIQLWQSESTISSNGVVTLLNTFGVENFVTQMPSDLEYDPQLSVVAEWRNNESLFDDHLYNAVIDGMLECAEMGNKIEYNPFVLPIVRILKGYSWIKNQFENEGPIPEGMSAVQAAKSDAFIEKHKQYKEETALKAEQFEETFGYTPPYWELVRMAELSTDCFIELD
jgi:hypothetical protein